MNQKLPQGKVFTANAFNEKSLEKFTEQRQLSIKDLRAEIIAQMTIANQKDQLINDMIRQNGELQADIEEAKNRCETLQKEVEALSKFQQQEQQKTEEEKQEDMELLANAIKIQQQALEMINGLSEEAIESLPTFEYEPGLVDSEICFCCFQPFQLQTNIKCLPCCHSFHPACVDESLKVSKYCPACQQEVIIC